jgi:hypothetical protein
MVRGGWQRAHRTAEDSLRNVVTRKGDAIPRTSDRRPATRLRARRPRVAPSFILTLVTPTSELSPRDVHIVWSGGSSDAKGVRRTVSVTAIHMPTGIEVTHTSEKPGGHTRREARVARDTLLTQCLEELEVAARGRMRENRAGRSTRRHGERPAPL